ncbi:LytTR family DNA-binding domain-containing protein [Aquimarina sp. D1M17]|uniref:LytR/AlgR family response regulator transcription factor n=1 Tax=Aquimarina acroporae TaxID=2937283 RepID=UPI0020C0F2AE|nr:LytTR family DNA-binding domain-containing protein [Aquimarina acroporae]MCK8522977.1 LytTR family DNA-binding domain-containing protein [Aquimarina acroporae]
MKYCIIDDEPIAHRIIEGYCENLPYLQKVGNCYDAFEAIALLQKNKVDMLFLDINMPKLSGFDLLKTMQSSPKVVVTSAYKEFALEGYELNVSDYLLKPFSFERFLQAIQKVQESQTKILPNTGRQKKDRFFLKGDKKMHQVHTDDILYIEAYGNYTKVFLTDEMIVSHEKISTMEILLPTSDFFRVHKSFIVATHHIKSIEGNRINIKDHIIPIGQTYKHHLKRLFGDM